MRKVSYDATPSPGNERNPIPTIWAAMNGNKLPAAMGRFGIAVNFFEYG
jgi:hypothetical protein